MANNAIARPVTFTNDIGSPQYGKSKKNNSIMILTGKLRVYGLRITRPTTLPAFSSSNTS
jgi:hypothetical protein